jgi:RHS repeat-associated protein
MIATDYYPFGMVARTYTSPEEYRYGFNGQEKVEELGASHTTATFWEYDGRLGRRWNMDPVRIPSMSPYACFNDNPIAFIDPLGLTPKKPPLGDRIKVFFGIGHFEGRKIKRDGKVVADNRVWRPNATGNAPNSKGGSDPKNNPPVEYDVDIIQPIQYIKRSQEEVTSQIHGGRMNDFPSSTNILAGDVYSASYDVNVDEVRRNRGAGTMDNLLYDFENATFNFGSSNTTIIVPRNDGGANLTITYSGDSRSAPMLRITNADDLRRWGALINAEVMNDYNTVTGIITYEIKETKLTTVTGLKTFEIVGKKKSRVNKPIYLKPKTVYIDE